MCASGSATAQPAHLWSLQHAISLLYPHRVCSSAFHTSTLLKLYILLSFVLKRSIVISSCASCRIFCRGL